MKQSSETIWFYFILHISSFILSPDLNLTAHVFVTLAMIGVSSRLGKSEAETLPFTVQSGVKTGSFFGGNGVKDIVFIDPGYRSSCGHLQSCRLVLKELDHHIGVRWRLRRGDPLSSTTGGLGFAVIMAVMR
jgi:hypothetical protein